MNMDRCSSPFPHSSLGFWLTKFYYHSSVPKLRTLFDSKIKNESKCLCPERCLASTWGMQVDVPAQALHQASAVVYSPLHPTPRRTQKHVAFPHLSSIFHVTCSQTLLSRGVCARPLTGTAGLSSERLWAAYCWALPLLGASLVF